MNFAPREGKAILGDEGMAYIAESFAFNERYVSWGQIAEQAGACVCGPYVRPLADMPNGLVMFIFREEKAVLGDEGMATIGLQKMQGHTFTGSSSLLSAGLTAQVSVFRICVPPPAVRTGVQALPKASRALEWLVQQPWLRMLGS